MNKGRKESKAGKHRPEKNKSDRPNGYQSTARSGHIWDEDENEWDEDENQCYRYRNNAYGDVEYQFATDQSQGNRHITERKMSYNSPQEGAYSGYDENDSPEEGAYSEYDEREPTTKSTFNYRRAQNGSQQLGFATDTSQGNGYFANQKVSYDSPKERPYSRYDENDSPEEGAYNGYDEREPTTSTSNDGRLQKCYEERRSDNTFRGGQYERERSTEFGAPNCTCAISRGPCPVHKSRTGPVQFGGYD